MTRRGRTSIGEHVGTAWRAAHWLPWLVVGALATAPAPVAAQGLAGTVGAFNVQRRLSYENAVYEQTGVAVGAEGAARIGPVRLRVGGLFGTLKGDGSALDPDVKLRTTAAALEVAVQPWVAVGAAAEARRFEAGAGVTTWKLLGAVVRLEPGLGLPGLRGLADLAFLPAGSANGGPKTKTAFRFTIGMSYESPAGPFLARVGYRFERYDFEASGLTAERYEQFGGIVAEVGIRLGKR
jgi:hypothetical protein